jgi:hypothetical protein
MQYLVWKTLSITWSGNYKTVPAISFLGSGRNVHKFSIPLPQPFHEAKAPARVYREETCIHDFDSSPSWHSSTQSCVCHENTGSESMITSAMISRGVFSICSRRFSHWLQDVLRLLGAASESFIKIVNFINAA